MLKLHSNILICCKNTKTAVSCRHLKTSVKMLDLNLYFIRIRGGTDGSRLTELGLPTPNVFTGGHNFHSKSEWASLSQMVCAEETMIELVKLWATKNKAFSAKLRLPEKEDAIFIEWHKRGVLGLRFALGIGAT